VYHAKHKATQADVAIKKLPVFVLISSKSVNARREVQPIVDLLLLILFLLHFIIHFFLMLLLLSF
jgi:hypothetical protein